MDKFNEVLNETINRYDETLRKLAEGEPVPEEDPVDDSEKKNDKDAK